MAEVKQRQNLDNLRNMNDQELVDELANQRFKLFNLRRENTTKQLENTAALHTARKQIARILTLQSERERAR